MYFFCRYFDHWLAIWQLSCFAFNDHLTYGFLELAKKHQKPSNHIQPLMFLWVIRCHPPRSSSDGPHCSHYRSVLESTAKAFQRFDAGEAVNFFFVLHGPRQLVLSPRDDAEDPEEEPVTDDEAER